MDYFQIKQDERINYTPVLLNLAEKFDRRWIIKEEYEKIPRIISFHLKEQDFMQYPALLDQQILMFSAKLKELVKIYEPDMAFKTLSLIEAKKGVNTLYYLPVLKSVQCLHEDTRFNQDKSVIKNLVLDQNKLEDLSIFKAGNEKTKHLIVRLDLMESILRRNIQGIRFKKIDVR